MTRMMSFCSSGLFAIAFIANPLQVLEDGEAAVHYFNGEGAYADRNATLCLS